MGETNDAYSEVIERADASNDLGFRLLSQLVERDSGKNVFLSPFSVAIALAMAYNGAEGRTKEALAKVLGFTGLGLERVNEATAAVMSMQDHLDSRVHLAIANSLWAPNGRELASDFIQRIEGYHRGEVANVDFADPAAADTINAWVAGKTNGKIKELVTPSMVASAILILINAIYFKGMWTLPFDEELTEEGPFALPDGSQKLCPMMSQSGHFDYTENESFQAISLPYGDRRARLVVILPRPTISTEEFQRTLTAENWRGWMSGLFEMEGDIVLPRFKVSYGTDLLPNLVALGGRELAGVDFLGMGAGPLVISRVIHKAFVEVNEEGTEAAAATALTMSMGLSYRFSMVVDRPFFFAIRDTWTGALLFMGFVLDPGQS